jgi:hypothetical protein
VIVRADAWRATRVDMILPDVAGAEPVVPPASFSSPFAFGEIDVRQYTPLSGDGIIAVRLLGAGALVDRPLPPQFQHALGGPGSLPGYAPSAVDCGARDIRLSTGEPGDVFATYGCERIALVQAEYRGPLRLGFWDDDKGRRSKRGAIHDPEWIIFFDAGRGWMAAEDGGSNATAMHYDAGAGFTVAGVGVYGAVPLTGEGRPLRLFVRLGPRF